MHTWNDAARLALQSLNHEASIGEILDEIERLQLCEAGSQNSNLILLKHMLDAEFTRISYGSFSHVADAMFYQRGRKWGLVQWLSAQEETDLLSRANARPSAQVLNQSSQHTIAPSPARFNHSTVPRVYTWKAAIVKALQDIGREATAPEIFAYIVDQKLVATQGRTPYETMTSRLYVSNIYRRSTGKNDRLFYNNGKLWGLATWLSGSDGKTVERQSPQTQPEYRISATAQSLTRRRSKPQVVPPQPVQVNIPLTLTEWERRLVPLVKSVQLLGEIAVTEEECQQLGQLIGRVVNKSKKKDLPDIIRCYFPASFALFMVAVGIYHGSGGNLWTPVADAIGKKLNANWHALFGETFEYVLIDFDLPLFPNMTAESFRFVSLILAHGGIPNYSLNDYFEKLLLRAVTKPWYADMAADELIDEWVHHGQSWLVDRPVLRFLEYGDQVAEDFVDRSREMAQSYLETGTIPDADDLGLPVRVVSAFQIWLTEDNPFEKNPSKSRTHFRLTRPVIKCDPWGEGVEIYLAMQQIPTAYRQSIFKWRIEIDGTMLDDLPVDLKRIGAEWRTSSKIHVLPRPVQTLTITFVIIPPTADEKPIERFWRYTLFDPESPLIIFNAETGTLIRRGHSLPAEDVWLIYPEVAQISFEGEAYQVEQFPELPWGWQSFSAEAWDLSEATQLTLTGATDKPVVFRVRPSEASLRPRLIGGFPFYTQHHNQPTTPLYIGQPPSILIPLIGRTTVAEELARWTLKIQSRGETEPGIVRTTSLSALQNILQLHQDDVELPLSALLGTAPFGTFDVRIRGPLGRDAVLSLRLLPRFDMTGHEMLLVPQAMKEAAPAKILFETDGTTSLSYQQDDDWCQISDSTQNDNDLRFYEAIISPEATQVTLTASKLNSQHKNVQIPVHIMLHRVRWSIINQVEDIQSPQWAGNTINYPLDKIEQAENSMLLVDLGYPLAILEQHTGQPVTAQFALRDGETNSILQTREMPSPRSVTKDTVWRIDLNGFYDTLKASDAPSFRLELQLIGYPSASDTTRCVPLNIHQNITVSNIELTYHIDAGSVTCCIKWGEATAVRNRRLRLWPQWQPWRKPLEVPIPDDALGQIQFSRLKEEMPPGQYLLEFFVVDPWVTASTPSGQPKPGSNTAMVTIVPAEVRMARLTALISNRPSFGDFLELVVIRHNMHETITAELQACLQFVSQASVSQIKTLHNLLETIQDKRLLTDLELALFSANKLSRVIQDYEAGRVTRGEFRTYMSFLPRTETLPVSTGHLLLQAPDDNAQSLGILQLVTHGEKAGFKAIIQLVHEGKMTEDDALTILKLNPTPAVNYLEDMLDDRICIKLLKRLSAEVGLDVSVVSVGHWVHCMAGWGVIKQIIDLETNSRLEEFVKGQSPILLKIILRPLLDYVPTELKISGQGYKISFSTRGPLYQCKKTTHCSFIAPNQSMVTNRHNRIAHGGLGPVLTVHHHKKSFIDLTNKLKFRARPPLNTLL